MSDDFDHVEINGIEPYRFSYSFATPPLDLGDSLRWRPVTGEATGELTVDLETYERLTTAADFGLDRMVTLETTQERWTRRAGWRGWIDWLLRRSPVKITSTMTIPNVRLTDSVLEQHPSDTIR